MGGDGHLSNRSIMFLTRYFLLVAVLFISIIVWVVPYHAQGTLNCPDVNKPFCSPIVDNSLRPLDPPGTMMVSTTPISCSSGCRRHVSGLTLCFQGHTFCFPLVPSPNAARDQAQWDKAVRKACKKASASCDAAAGGGTGGLNNLCVEAAGGQGPGSFCIAVPPAVCEPPVTNEGDGCIIKKGGAVNEACVRLLMQCDPIGSRGD